MTIIYPVRYLDNLQNPPSPISGELVLSTSGDGSSEVILDYGRAEGGIPVFEVRQVESSHASVSIQITYSETSQGLHSEAGDGPFFLFSNAMDTYRVNTHTFVTTNDKQFVEARFAQKSQRYQKIVLTSPNSTIYFSSVGFREQRSKRVVQSSFRCSNKKLEKIWNIGVRTLEMCSVEAGETMEAWEVTDQGTRIIGQHWAPCRQGTRWADYCAKFQVKIDAGGASWGIHMVANGLILCIDIEKRSLAAFEGLSDSGGVFPTTSHGAWPLPAEIDLTTWLDVCTTAIGTSASVEINGHAIASLSGLEIHPILGGSANNTGSIAFGGPSHYSALYKSLSVRSLSGDILYENDLLLSSKARTMADFAVGTNNFACTIDGAKRDRACFAGDLFIMGRSICYSTGFMEAVLGSITLLSSHQTAAGYIGNLCPIQAPVHTGEEEPPTYAFYSLSYALALIVATKDYVMHTGDIDTMKTLYSSFQKLLAFTCGFMDKRGIIVAPPPLSMEWFPMGGPIFGASGKINLALYDALQSMGVLSELISMQNDYRLQANQLKADIRASLWNELDGILRMSDLTTPSGICQDIHAYGLITGVADPHVQALDKLKIPSSGCLPLAFQDIERWDSKRVVSPYASGFAAEALLIHDQGEAAVELIERVWGTMVDESDLDYSGGCWEAMTPNGKPLTEDTSLMHGWSTSPVFLLPQYLGGLSPIEPGWNRFKVQPVLAGIETIDIDLATPAGNISVILVRRDLGDMTVLELKVPVGAVAEVHIPKGWTHTESQTRGMLVDAQKIIVNGSTEAFKIVMTKLNSAKLALDDKFPKTSITLIVEEDTSISIDKQSDTQRKEKTGIMSFLHRVLVFFRNMF